MKDALIRATCQVVRIYLSYCPIAFGKHAIWNKLVRPYLLWRDMEVEAHAKFGARFRGALGDRLHSYLFFFGVWEPTITEYMSKLLHSGDIVIDIGANVGAHALHAAKLVGQSGRVHAIEASPSIFKRLQENLSVNHVTNVISYNVAVVDASSPVIVYRDSHRNLGATTIFASAAERLQAHAEAQVAGRPLPDIVPVDDILAARLIKVDVEGAEWLVLLGLAGLLPMLSDRTRILLEVDPLALEESGGSVAKLLELCHASGFRACQIENGYEPDFYINTPFVRLYPWRGARDRVSDLVLKRASA